MDLTDLKEKTIEDLGVLADDRGITNASGMKRSDLVLAIPMRWSAGWVLNDGITYGPNRNSFGHSGWGGSLGCADPDARLGIGYAMNQMCPNLSGDPRSLGLLEAVYGCL